MLLKNAHQSIDHKMKMRNSIFGDHNSVYNRKLK